MECQPLSAAMCNPRMPTPRIANSKGMEPNCQASVTRAYSGNCVGKAGKLQNQAAFQARAINLVPVTHRHQPPPPGQAVCEARLDAVPPVEGILKLKLDVNGSGAGYT